MSKYTPISVFVPGDMRNELALTPREAKLLIERTAAQITLWNNLREEHGAAKARMAMCRSNDASESRRSGGK